MREAHEVHFETRGRACAAKCSCTWSHEETGVLAARRAAEEALEHLRQHLPQPTPG